MKRIDLPRREEDYVVVTRMTQKQEIMKEVLKAALLLCC